MPYSIDWYIENEIIFCRYYGKSTADELRSSLTRLHQLIDSSPKRFVHMINDVGDVTEPLSVMESIQIIREVGEHERDGWVLTIRSKSPALKLSASLSNLLFQARTRTVNTMPEAIAHLKEVDSTIHWEKADESVLEPALASAGR